MADNINVDPTPIQRNYLDVAMELTQLHFQEFSVKNDEHIKQMFTEYYSLILLLERTRVNNIVKLKECLPEEIAKYLY